MKKMIAVLFVLTMLLSIAACRITGGEETPQSPAQMMLADFIEQMKNDPSASVSDIAETLVSGEWGPFAGATMPVEPGYLNGFTGEITGFAEGEMFGPAIGAIPFIGYIFRLENESDAEAFAAQLKEKYDLRWNVCTQADEMVCAASEDKVFFVMSPASFED